jgi:hypothetical protein
MDLTLKQVLGQIVHSRTGACSNPVAFDVKIYGCISFRRPAIIAKITPYTFHKLSSNACWPVLNMLRWPQPAKHLMMVRRFGKLVAAWGRSGMLEISFNIFPLSHEILLVWTKRGLQTDLHSPQFTDSCIKECWQWILKCQYLCDWNDKLGAISKLINAK